MAEEIENKFKIFTTADLLLKTSAKIKNKNRLIMNRRKLPHIHQTKYIKILTNSYEMICTCDLVQKHKLGTKEYDLAVDTSNNVVRY